MTGNKQDPVMLRSMLYIYILLTQYCAGDKIEKIEMGWTCGAYGLGEGGVWGLGGETRGKETTGET